MPVSAAVPSVTTFSETLLVTMSPYSSPARADAPVSVSSVTTLKNCSSFRFWKTMDVWSPESAGGVGRRSPLGMVSPSNGCKVRVVFSVTKRLYFAGFRLP